MTRRHRNGLLACLAGAALALAGSAAISGWRVMATFRHTLELFYGDRSDPVQAPEIGSALLVLGAGALLVGAIALAIAGRRAALALERASLIERLG
jgi:hypothetical protein